MTAITMTKSEGSYRNALDIGRQAHSEARILAAEEVERIQALLESLTDDDWQKPTDCTEWTVHDVVAHLAGAVASLASWAEFKRQNMGNPYMDEVEIKIDAINRRQVEDRASATNEELVAEFRENGPKAVRTRQRIPWPVRQLRLPLGPPLGFASIGYMMDTIYTRDQWMHRHDIAFAAGREMVVTPDHDGRIVALVIRDIGRKLKGKLQRQNINLILTGDAGGRFHFGENGLAAVTIEMDALTFNRLASGRLPADVALKQAAVEGDRELAAWFLIQANVPY